MTKTKQGPVYTSTIHQTNNNPTKNTRTPNDDTVKCKRWHQGIRQQRRRGNTQRNKATTYMTST